MKKKFILISLLLAITLSMTACNQAETTSKEISTESSISESNSEVEQSESSQSESKATSSLEESSAESSLRNSASSTTSSNKENSKNTAENSKTESQSESKTESKTNSKTNTSITSKPTNSSTVSSSTASNSSNTNSSRAESSSSSSNNSSKKPSNSSNPPAQSHTHSYTSKTVKATCTSGGYTVHTCSCGASYTDNKTSALGHSWSDWKTVKQATSSAEGKKERSCSRCGKTESKSIDKIKGKYDVQDNKSTESLVEERVLYYMNKYRQEEGHRTVSRLTKLSKYDKIRSQQLTRNFAHDDDDIHAAATQLKYGQYINPKDYGVDGEPYYDAPDIEAIGMVGTRGTVDDTAQAIVNAFRNSPGHWGYVGAANDFYKDWKYAGVGCTYELGTWYVCISISHTTEYE